MSFEELATQITTLVREQPGWLAPILLVLAFGESIAFLSLILPFWWMLLALGALVGSDPTAFMIALAAASVGAALGDWVSYWLGYHFSDRINAMWPFSRYPELMPRGERFFATYGVWAIVLGRFSGPLRATVPVVAGATRMNHVTFQIANWLSAVLWAGVLLLFGDALGRLLAMAADALGF
ncbi:MAG: DedA family protein [Pseudomonadota bacterium]